MATTQDLSTGKVIRFNNDLCQIIELQFRNPGNKHAFFQAKMRNLKTGRLVEYKFRSGEKVDFVRIEIKQMQYLYSSADEIFCMDPESFEQISLPVSIIGDKTGFLKEGIVLNISFESEIPVAVELPPFVDLEVVYTEPGLRGDTSTRALKPAKLETGAMVNVPLFISQGERVRIDTRTSEYSERAK
ncbi:MAG: elongation factor P [Bacteroidetes bacterium]|nr:elongation factor P [Bacteroidota bacterium]